MIRAFTMENASGESKIKLEYDGQVIVSCIVPGSFEFVAEYPQWERESATLGRKKNKSEEEARRFAFVQGRKAEEERRVEKLKTRAAITAVCEAVEVLIPVLVQADDSRNGSKSSRNRG